MNYDDLNKIKIDRTVKAIINRKESKVKMSTILRATLENIKLRPKMTLAVMMASMGSVVVFVVHNNPLSVFHPVLEFIKWL